MTVFDRYLEQAKDFARRLVRTETGTRRWATVTAVDPVRITYDGTTVQGIISPVVLGVPVALGDRVRAHTIHDRTYITRANPTPPEPPAGPQWIGLPGRNGYHSTGRYCIVNGIATVAVVLEAASNRPAGTVENIVLPNAALAYSGPDNTRFPVTISTSETRSARLFPDGHVNLYNAPAMVAGDTIRGLYSYPVG